MIIIIDILVKMIKRLLKANVLMVKETCIYEKIKNLCVLITKIIEKKKAYLLKNNLANATLKIIFVTKGLQNNIKTIFFIVNKI